jgi:antitoxin (DNA-binding transcriptional repressor) of toxin-antitoxin stability system
MTTGKPTVQFVAETDFIRRVEEYVDRAEQGEAFHLVRDGSSIACLLPPTPGQSAANTAAASV